MNRTLLAATAAALALVGCQTAPTTMTKEAYDAKIACELEAAKVSGYDWIDAISRRNEVERLCLQQRGCRKNMWGPITCAAPSTAPATIVQHGSEPKPVKLPPQLKLTLDPHWNQYMEQP